MKFGKILLSSAIALTVAGTVAAEPTRGFMGIEHAKVIDEGAADLAIAIGGYGASLSLAGGELILNNNEVGLSRVSDAVFKYGLQGVDLLPGMKSALAVYGGISMATGTGSYTNLLAGAALTLDLDAIEATVSPELIVDGVMDKTYLNIKADGFFNLGETKFGKFKPGAMLAITTEKNVKYPDGANIYAGVRWEYNEKLTLDIIPLAIDGNTRVMIPGELALTARF